jgi:hypothetical protein
VLDPLFSEYNSKNPTDESTQAKHKRKVVNTKNETKQERKNKP